MVLPGVERLIVGRRVNLKKGFDTVKILDLVGVIYLLIKTGPPATFW